MGTYQIAVLPGDGIGPEVMAAALDVLEGVGSSGFRLEFSRHDFGAERYRRTGIALAEDVVADCRSAHAVLLAAMGPCHLIGRHKIGSTAYLPPTAANDRERRGVDGSRAGRVRAGHRQCEQPATKLRNR